MACFGCSKSRAVLASRPNYAMLLEITPRKKSLLFDIVT
jgi:hypothetical protein